MNRRIVGIIAALVLAAIGTTLIITYVEREKNAAVAAEGEVDVWIVDETIPLGTSGKDVDDFVRKAEVPKDAVAEDGVEQLADIKDRVAAIDLVPGEQLVASRWVLQGQEGRSADLKDKLTVTVELEAQRAMGGQLRAGDTVAVLANFDPFLETGADGNETPNSTHILLHKVPVVAVQWTEQQGSDDASADESSATVPRGRILVTLAVDAPSAELVVFTADHGRLWLANEPKSASEDGTKEVTRGNVYG